MPVDHTQGIAPVNQNTTTEEKKLPTLPNLSATSSSGNKTVIPSLDVDMAEDRNEVVTGETGTVTEEEVKMTDTKANVTSTDGERATKTSSVSSATDKTNQYTNSQILEIDNISFHTTSLNASRDSQNSSSNEDSLFQSTRSKWEIPALNTSKLMDRSGFGSKEKRDSLCKLLQAQPGGDSFRSLRHSTPVVTVMKKKVTPIKSQHETSEKINLDLLLDEM